jgi:nicotinamidase-related amidase
MKERNQMQKKALVVIDLQNDITKNYKEIIDNVNRTIDWAEENEIPVVSKNIFVKSKGNALTSENFADFIRKNEISEFYITGADAIACVKSTVFNMCRENYTVTVLSDCITSYDKRKIDEMLNYYKKNGCKIMTMNELLNSE